MGSDRNGEFCMLHSTVSSYFLPIPTFRIGKEVEQSAYKQRIEISHLATR